MIKPKTSNPQNQPNCLVSLSSLLIWVLIPPGLLGSFSALHFWLGITILGFLDGSIPDSDYRFVLFLSCLQCSSRPYISLR